MNLTNNLKKKEVWSIGIYTGTSPFNLSDPALGNPVLTADHINDITAEFVADPFMLKHGSRWYMFFEVMEAQSQLGKIALASSPDGLSWQYEQVILDESFHFSYPYVFKEDGNIYMVPETWMNHKVTLYQAVDFPTLWKPVTNLIEGKDFVDPNLFQHEGLWWLMVGNRRCNEMHLYYSEKLQGPFLEHPLNPVVTNNKQNARPAGRITNWNNRLFRFGQDCTQTYGGQVWASEIIQLTTSEYSEKQLTETTVLTKGQAEWNRDGMHHLDAHNLKPNQWIACVDGKEILD